MIKLKNQELQKALDKISGGDFSRQLNEREWKPGTLNIIEFGEKIWCNRLRFEVSLLPSDIEFAPDEYNPRCWNYWPACRPKIGVYRVEFDSFYSGIREKKRLVWRFDGDYWRDVDGGRPWHIPERLRFKPWDDPEPEQVEKKPYAGEDNHPDAVYTREFLAREKEREEACRRNHDD